MNITWLITSELANQCAQKVLFTCVVYTNNGYGNGNGNDNNNGNKMVMVIKMVMVMDIIMVIIW